MALGDGQRKTKNAFWGPGEMHFGSWSSLMSWPWKESPTCILGACKTAFWFAGPFHLTALEDGQRKCKIHLWSLENAF